MHFARSFGASVRGALRLRPLVLAAMTAIASSSALAGAVIYNNVDPAAATLALGVNDAGHLNFSGSGAPANASAYGLSYRFPDGNFYDSTAPGCLCEGWGVAVTLADGLRTSGFASIDNGGSGGLTGGSFSSSATRATSQIGLSGAPIVVTHAYGVSLSASLFQANVTITNTGSTAVNDVVYRRAMDWDVPHTEFNEYVTHSGVAANLESLGGNVRFASNNGFANVDPLSGAGEITIGGGGEGGGGVEGGGDVAVALLAPGISTVNIDFEDAGAADHGSVFDFAFGNLAAGESRTFNIFYGAAANETAALAAISVVDPTLYSLGQSTDAAGLPANDQPTFIFAFGGVGGIPPGSDPANPLLPLVDVGTGVMTFDAPAPRLWYDPPFAKGFTYKLAGGATFKSFRLPAGFSGLTLKLPDGTLVALADGAEYTFATPLDSFEILGLDLDIADPGYGTAFPIFLDWEGAASRLEILPLLDTTGGTVPIPGTALLVVTGLGLMGAARRRKAAQ